MSKKFTIVNSSIHSNPVSPGLVDKFRTLFGSWSTDVLTKRIYYNRNDRLPFNLNEYQISQEEFLKINKKYEIDTIPPQNSSFVPDNHMIIVPTTAYGSVPYLEEVHRLSFYVAKKSNKGDLFSLINYGIRYENYASSFDLPNNYIEDQNILSPDRRNSPETFGYGILDTYKEIDVDFVYQSENIPYEKIANQAAVEYALPGYYEMTKYLETNEDIDAEKFITSTVGEYESFNSKRSRFKNIIVSPDGYKNDLEKPNLLLNSIREVDYLDTHRTIKGAYQKEKMLESVPNYVKIRIDRGAYEFDESVASSKTDLNFASSVQKTNKIILDNFMFFKQDTVGKNDFDLGTLLMRWHLQYRNQLSAMPRSNIDFTTSREKNRSIGEYETNTEKYFSYDFFKWLLEHSPSLINNFPSEMTLIGQGTDSVDLATIGRFELYEIKFIVSKIIESFCHGSVPGTVNLEFLANRFVSLYSKMYTFKDMIRCGGLGESEILFYKIEKFNGSNTNIQPLQTFLIPNVFDKYTEYIDTQVKYGVQYTYRISEVRAVLGTEYEYVQLNQPQSLATRGEFVFGVRQYPRIRIIEVPIYTKSGNILGEPPLSPQFQLFPVRRKKNKFKMFFEPTYGKEKQYATPLTNADSILFDQKIRQTFGSSGQLYFSSKSSVNRYEIYFTEERPTKTDKNNNSVYAKFVDSMYAAIETDNDLTSPIIADSATVQLNLTPNKKYYFTFIARNRLGMASNPTGIYEVELVNDSGYSYPRITPLEFNNDIIGDMMKSSKTMNKIISIKASTIQAAISQNNLLDIDGNPKVLRGAEIKPGPDGPAGIFPSSKPRNSESEAIRDGKRFKLRFSSKNSGKTFDINITFKHNRVQSPYDIQPLDQGLRPIPVDRASIGTTGKNQQIPSSIPPVTQESRYSCRYSNNNPMTGYYYPEIGSAPSMIPVPTPPDPIKDLPPLNIIPNRPQITPSLEKIPQNPKPL